MSDGTFVAGAVVEAFQGTVLHGAASTNASGNYSINGLADGTYAVRASASGFVPQVSEGVTIVSSGTVIANLSLNAGIAIHSPVAATVINDHEVLVTGQFDTSLGAELGINVNGYVALQDGDEFAALIPVDAETTSLIATVTNTAGTALGSHTIPVTVQPPTSEQILFFKPSPTIVLISEPVSFTLTSLNPISQIQLDANGDGTTDFTGTTLEGQSVTFAEAGLYFPLVNVTEPGGTVRTATALIQVVDISQLDLLLKSKWNSMKDALRSGNTAEAATYIVLSKRTNYQNIFDNLTVSFASIDQYLTNIIFVRQRGPNVEYKMVRTEGLNQAAYPVFFVLDEDGVWRIKGF